VIGETARFGEQGGADVGSDGPAGGQVPAAAVERGVRVAAGKEADCR